MTKLPARLFCSNCGTILPKNLMDLLIVGKTAYCENCGSKFKLNFTNIEHDPKEIKTESKRKPIDWQKTGVDLEQNMIKLGKKVKKVSKKVVRESIKAVQKAKEGIVKEIQRYHAYYNDCHGIPGTWYDCSFCISGNLSSAGVNKHGKN